MIKEIDAADVELSSATGRHNAEYLYDVAGKYHRLRIFNDDGHLIWEESYDKRD